MNKLYLPLTGIIYISLLFSQNLTSTLSSEYIQEQKQSIQSEVSGHSYDYRLEVKAGWSSRTAELSQSIIEPHRDYAEQLKKGYNISLSFLFFRKGWSNGLQLSCFKTSNSGSETYLLDDNGFLMNIGYREDDISVLFIGSEFYYQYKPDPYFILYGKITPGFLRYTNDVHFVNSTITYSGNTWGINSSIGLEYLMNNNFGLNFDISFLRALSLKIKQSGNDEKENLNRYDINIGLIIYL